MNPVSQFQQECCAYTLATRAMYHEKPPFFAPLPGEALYEITQIFLNCIGALQHNLKLETEDLLPLASRFFSFHFNQAEPRKNCPYPVEVIFAAFAVQDISRRSPYALFYSVADDEHSKPLAAEAKRVTNCLNRLEDVIKDPTLAKKRLSDFHFAFGSFLAAITHSPFLLKKIGENGAVILKKYSGLENVASLACMPGLKERAEKYLNEFKCLSSLFESIPAQEKLFAFLEEWNRMPEGIKANARQTDPFVKEFSNCVERMDKLSWMKSQICSGLN